MIPKLLILPENYEDKIQEFYNKEGKQKVENYTREELKKLGFEPKLIRWDNKRGLEGISMYEGGIDLERNTFDFHNIYYESDLGKILHKIIKYYFKLLESS